MALKESNKNRIKVSKEEDVTFPKAHEELMDSITNLAELNQNITVRSFAFSAIGVVVGIAILLLII